MSKKTVDSRSEKVFDFLAQIAEHNDRDWFKFHRSLYDTATEAFNEIVEGLIARISEFEPEVGRLSPHDCTYRIYRDVRFSNDKRPYKLHMGAYINSHGKKSMHGGYYIHFQPGNCFAAGGCYCLDNKTLKAIRESIVDNLDEFRNIVEKNEFKSLFPVIGEERLKTAPKGFPKDFQYLSYLQPKDYSVSTPVDDDLLLSKGWEEKVVEIFREMKPLLDFVNYTVDDYE